MWRIAVGSLVIVVAVATGAAPVPKELLAPPTYFPTALGSKWEYALDGEKETALVVEVTKVEVIDGARVVQFEQTGGPKTRDYPERYRIAADGVFLLTAAGDDITPPRLDQRPKPKADDTWDGPHAWRRIDYTCTTTVGGAEKVEVPAGTFATLPHVQAYTNFRVPQVWTAWYAPGVGRVKFVNYEGQAHVLLKYTPGKERK
jgi:hypothetical protein